MHGSVNIRRAEPRDAAAIARFHVASWRAAYRDLAPPEVLAELTEDRRLAQWQHLLSPQVTGQLFLVCEIDGTLAGVGGAGPTAHPAYGGRGQISLLYIAPEHQRSGLGRRLMHDLALWLESAGHRGVALGVVDGNVPAMRFYETLGGQSVGAYEDEGPAWRSHNLVYAWDDLATLLAATAGPERR